MAKSETAVTPWQQKREQLLAEMTPATRSVALDLEKKRAMIAKGGILIIYDMGARLRDVVDKPSEHGEEAVEQLSAYFDMGQKGPDELRDMKNFATEFTKDFVNEQIAKPLANGQFLSYKHFRMVMRLKSKKDQLKLLERARNECLSANALEDLIQAEYARKNVRTSGRKPAKPTTPMAGLQKAFSQAQQLSNFLTQHMEESVFDPLKEMPPDEVNDTVLQRGEVFETQAVEAQHALEKALRQWVPVKERLLRVMSKKAEAAEKAAKTEAVESDGKPEAKPKPHKLKPRKAGKPTKDKMAKKDKKKLRRRPAAV